MELKNKNMQQKGEVITFKTNQGVTVRLHGKPNFEIWAKKMLDVYGERKSKET